MLDGGVVDSTPTLPDTDPVLSLDSSSQSEICWGRLLPIGCKQTTTALVQESYRVGRSPNCEIYITKGQLDQELYNSISKYHFKITRRLVDGYHIVFLEDLSSNGTYVNGRIVGRDSRIALANSDEISLSKASHKVYMFVDSKVSSWLTNILSSEYQILKHLGAGGFSEVKLVIDKKTCQKYAMKKISKDRIEANKIYNEVKLLQHVNHPFIIKFQRITDTSEAIFICLEYMPSGDLMQRLQTNKRLKERETKFIFYQLILAVQYLHNEGITHRDIKAENVLIQNEAISGEPRVKLTDFGLSKLVEDSETHLRTTCGTLKYMAPEILVSHSANSSYTSAVDIWSLGILVFLCLSGEYPFDNNNPNEPMAVKITHGLYNMSPNAWQGISENAICVVKRMLVTNPNQRITAKQIMITRWLLDHSVISKVDRILEQEHFANSDNESSNNLMAEIRPDMKRQRY